MYVQADNNIPPKFYLFKISRISDIFEFPTDAILSHISFCMPELGRVQKHSSLFSSDELRSSLYITLTFNLSYRAVHSMKGGWGEVL